MPRALAQLRAQGVKLRHCAAFRLPDHVVRMRVMSPTAQDMLLRAWEQVG
jgi:histidinol-phosphate/aromatic aminotransferase/cobyric acid decarboxylase-like protein